MRILCTNDDGVYARGLESLVKIAREISDDVWVCAPQEEQSGAARALTLAHPVRIRQYDERRFAVTGTPSDAVLMGIQKVLGGEKPDLILSGVNNGQNLAEDVTVSGTIAGAFQGMAMGVKSIALSLSRLARDEARWETPEAHGAKVVKLLLEAGWPDNVVMNVNFPDRAPDDVAGIEATEQGHRDAVQLFAEERKDLRGGTYYWYGYTGALSDPAKGTDLRAIYDGRISITPLHLSLTDFTARKALEKTLAENSV
ncbi:5'/3'-nucleotidase SurE [Hyphococcus luteus]|uniref:5'-nucleotidase SurE n=1 Tax=Hyphococcus luteus TaxID=2058213 RepID=A0A2S7K0X7_9PROT|nr:5'/3'-nucleotidase SurE [Marinicaulis flavus]PQA86111.1 5'/3'-nucleotidase SurE [Marinicaulis flavus]